MCADLLNGAVGGRQKLNSTLAQNDLPLGIWGGIAQKRVKAFLFWNATALRLKEPLI